MYAEPNIKVKEGSLGYNLVSNAYTVEKHLKVDNVIVVYKEDWEEVVPDNYVILDTRFGNIVTEDYLGEWDEIFEL